MAFIETEKIELKGVYNDSFEKEVVAFLNTEGGTIYVGVEDNGNVIGIDNVDKAMLYIADSITDRILPNPQEFVETKAVLEQGKMIIVVEVKKGNNLYYIKKFGRSASGCYVRIGTSARSMTEEQIEKAYIKTLNIPKITMVDKRSRRQDLTFNEFKSIITFKGIHYSDTSFEINFNLRNSNNEYNLMAFLLSDQNDTSIKVCKFDGLTKVEFLSRKEFAEGCILRQMEEAYAYANNVINLIQTDVSGGKNRVDTPLIDPNSLKEAWYNAVCHNLWVEGIPPAIYGFEDRVEIISHGTLREDLTLDEFYNGISKPINKEFAEIFLKLNYMEQSGKGISTIISKYGKDVFHFGSSFIECILPFNIVDKEKYYKLIGKNSTINSTIKLNETHKKIINMIKNNSEITVMEIASALNKTESNIKKAIKYLKENGIVERIGSRKDGCWKVNQ